MKNIQSDKIENELRQKCAIARIEKKELADEYVNKTKIAADELGQVKIEKVSQNFSLILSDRSLKRNGKIWILFVMTC